MYLWHNEVFSTLTEVRDAVEAFVEDVLREEDSELVFRGSDYERRGVAVREVEVTVKLAAH